MVGNNSCGSHSLVYGSTRDHLLEAKVILSDGSEALLKGVSPKEVDSIRAGASLEKFLFYDRLITLLSDKENQKEIVDNYPDNLFTQKELRICHRRIIAFRLF